MAQALSTRSLTLLVASTFPAKSQKVSIWSRARRIWPSRSRASGQSVALARMALRSRSSARFWFFTVEAARSAMFLARLKGAIEPKLEPHACQIAAMLGNKAGLSVEMGQAGLMEPAMPLLGGIAVRYPHLGLDGHSSCRAHSNAPLPARAGRRCRGGVPAPRRVRRARHRPKRHNQRPCCPRRSGQAGRGADR